MRSQVPGEVSFDRWLDDITLIAVDRSATPPQVTLRFAQWQDPGEPPFDLDVDFDRLLAFEVEGRVLYTRE